MTSSLVGSEMCIRDSPIAEQPCREKFIKQRRRFHILAKSEMDENLICLLYTSDAADELDGVDL
eukprot:2629612-Prorocentrum_lima.AAC.1